MGRYALLIGNGEYNDEKFHQLALPEADVASLETVLSDKLAGDFDEIVLLINSNWYEARPKITKFFKGRDRNDFLLMFFAGHGVKDKSGQLYLTFKDTEHDDLEGTAIPDAFVARQMDRSRARGRPGTGSVSDKYDRASRRKLPPATCRPARKSRSNTSCACRARERRSRCRDHNVQRCFAGCRLACCGSSCERPSAAASSGTRCRNPYPAAHRGSSRGF